MLTCFLFKIWQMTIIHIYLAPMLNNKSDIWQSWKLCVTFYWILGTHVDPYHALAWTQSKQLHWNHTAEKQEYLDVLSYPIVVLHWLKQMALTCVSKHQSDKAVLLWSLPGLPLSPSPWSDYQGLGVLHWIQYFLGSMKYRPKLTRNLETKN